MAYLQLAENYLAAAPMEMYIFIPAGFRGSREDVYIREDILDDLPEMEYRSIMQELAPYQPSGMSAKDPGKKAARKAARAEKKEGKGGAARREAKQLRVETRAKARGEGGGLFGKAIDAATNIFGKKDLDIEFDQAGGVNVAFDPATEESFFSKNKIPLLIGGAAVVAGVIYLATKKKK
jgi:hypothetical protein